MRKDSRDFSCPIINHKTSRSLLVVIKTMLQFNLSPEVYWLEVFSTLEATLLTSKIGRIASSSTSVHKALVEKGKWGVWCFPDNQKCGIS